MGKKSRKKQQNPAPKLTPVPTEKNYWKVIAVAATVLCAGLIGKIVFFPGQQTVAPTVVEYRPPGAASAAPVDASLESRILEVASNFRCACGGCGELPLDECTCTMPRGAKEEKDFIREQLEKGLSVEQVAALVEAEYGLRNM